MNVAILIVLVILIVGALPLWPYSRPTAYSSGWGYYPAGGLILLLVILILLGLDR